MLATLSGNSNPFVVGNDTYTGNVWLSANQIYYLVAGVTVGGGSYCWSGTFYDNQTGTSPWNIGDQQFSSPGRPGAIWNVATTIANRVTLDATPVPEPGTLVLAAIGFAAMLTEAGLRRRQGPTQ